MNANILKPRLFIEIYFKQFVFIVAKIDEKNELVSIDKFAVPVLNFDKSNIFNYELFSKVLKENIFSLEKKFKCIFKDVFLILNDFNITFINFTGFKKLNGSQVLRENITYILNSLKSSINDVESKKTILHIFNSNFFLDKQKIINPPIGLFGDLYAHELSFCLINNNDYKNLDNIFNLQNLKIKKIFLKSYVEGAYISNMNPGIDTFFYIKINENNSKVFYFENDALKFEQNFDFGFEIISKDISKITSLSLETVKKIISKFKFNSKIPESELIEKKILEGEINKKIRKKLIYEIAFARIKEIAEKILLKNINFKNFVETSSIIFLELTDKSHYDNMKELYDISFSPKENELKYLENFSTEAAVNNLNKIVQFGWKKEAIPIANVKKSIIARFFETLFN